METCGLHDRVSGCLIAGAVGDAQAGLGTEMMLSVTPPKKSKKESLVKIAKGDVEWISPGIATEVFRRASDRSEPTCLIPARPGLAPATITLEV